MREGGCAAGGEESVVNRKLLKSQAGVIGSGQDGE
jgi:hypothetical protein